MPPRPYVLTEASLTDVKDTDWQVAVLPWGATEPHNFQLPYGTDTLQASAVAMESLKRASCCTSIRILCIRSMPPGPARASGTWKR